MRKFKFSGGILASAIGAVLCCTPAQAQVFDLDAGASDTQAYYGNWAGSNPDAANPPAGSYRNYRKGGVTLPNPGLPVAANNADNISGTWTNISHGGAVPCCGNPGMFLGTSPSTSSYSSSAFFVRDNTELFNEHDFDSNGRRRFDMRFGFTESPDDWLNGKAANSGQMDLWTGDHGSDTIYIQSLVGATDDELTQRVPNEHNLIDQTNNYVTMNQELMGQSGNATTIGDERDRDRFYRSGTGLSLSEVQVNDLSQPGLGTFTLTASGLNNSAFDTGIGYSDDVPIKWWMELNDPDAAPGTLAAREVKFNYQAGNVVYSQVFDPGDAANPIEPNPTNDPGNTFQDGFFDWENAYPIFFVGPSGGATVEGSLTLGFTNEGGGLVGDFDGNGAYECSDVDSLVAAIASGSADAQFDLTGDGNIDIADLTAWRTAAGTVLTASGNPIQEGDSDLSGSVDVSDFNNWNANKFTTNASWCNGDFNADGVVDVGDFNLWNGNKFTNADSASAVPEPASGLLMLFATIFVVGLRRRR